MGYPQPVPSRIVAQTERKNASRRVATGLVLLLLLALVVIGVWSRFSQSPVSHSTITNGRSLGSLVNPEQIASKIGLQPSDLGLRSTLQPGAPSGALSRPTAPSYCTPLSSKPWLADVVSPTYSNYSTGPFVSTDVVIMSNQALPQDALRSIDAKSYGPECFKTHLDAVSQQSIASINQTSPCNVHLVSSTISPLLPGQLGPDTSGWRYESTEICTSSGMKGVIFVDIVNKVVGQVFLQGTFRSIGVPTPVTVEQNVMAAMTARTLNLIPRGASFQSGSQLNAATTTSTVLPTTTTTTTTTQPTTVVPPCGSYITCTSTPVPVSQSLSINEFDLGRSFGLAVGGEVTFTFPLGAAISSVPPGLTLVSSSSSSSESIFVFKATAAPGGDVTFMDNNGGPSGLTTFFSVIVAVP